MKKSEILKGFEIKKVKSMPGHEGTQLLCELHYEGQLAADFFDDANGGEPRLDFVHEQAKDDIYKIVLDRGVAEFMLKNGWAFMEAPHKIDFKTRVGWVIDELFNIKQQEKQNASFNKRMQKDFITKICYGKPSSGEYKTMGWKIPIAQVVTNPKDGKQLVQDLIDKIKKEKLQEGEVILNTNLEKLGLII